MLGFEIEIAHFNASGKEVGFKKDVPVAARRFLKAATKTEAKDWLKNNGETLTEPWRCPFSCAGKKHEFELKEVKIKDIPKDATVVNLH